MSIPRKAPTRSVPFTLERTADERDAAVCEAIRRRTNLDADAAQDLAREIARLLRS